MKSLERMIGLLDLFEDASLEWTMEKLHDHLGYTRSTLYRYVKVLTDAGLLAPVPGGGYTLGPRVAELDYQMRTRDPLIGASRPVMAELVEEVSGTALLCRRYRDRVLCVHQEGDGAVLRAAGERGRARPILQGAASRIILAWVPSQTLGQIYARNGDAFVATGLGGSLVEVRATLKGLRQAGHDMSVEQGVSGTSSIAAPIFDRRQAVLGSLSVTVGQTNLSRERRGFIADRVMFCARIISKAIAREEEIPGSSNFGAQVRRRPASGSSEVGSTVPAVEAKPSEA